MCLPTYTFYLVVEWTGQLYFAEILLSFVGLLMQEGWCDSVGSVEEIQAKLLKRQEAAAKRERAMAYALAHQVILQTIKLLLIRLARIVCVGWGWGLSGVCM